MTQITIVGVGALGSHVVLALRNVGQLRVIDFDRVEAKNVEAQFHSRTAQNKLKVQGLQQTMQFLFGTKIEAIPHRLVDDNATQLLGRSDLVIDCLDNGAARRIVQQYVRQHTTPCLHGALAANGAFGRVTWDEKFVIDDETAAGATCEDGQHLPFITMVSALIARSAQEFLDSGRKVGFQIHPTGVFSV